MRGAAVAAAAAVVVVVVVVVVAAVATRRVVTRGVFCYTIASIEIIFNLRTYLK